MDLRTPQSRLIKRPAGDSSQGKSRKRSCSAVGLVEDSELSAEKVFKFRVLLPNGTSVDLKIHGPGAEMPLEEFVHGVRHEYLSVMRGTEASKQRRNINWTTQDLHLVDANANKITKILNFKNFKPNSNNPHILIFHDGSTEVGDYENMWDLTPDTDLLTELPEHYTFETALADLIDNSLQAVWSNGRYERRLISVEMAQNRIKIFDTGPGMDGSDENSIARWGKMGASLHRLAGEQGIGSKPPYLTPFFGMFGYGGSFATMHLGRRALVTSKTKQSKKVYILHLEREALLSSSSRQTWRTNGGLRDPEKDEIEKAPHGSFTKVEIFEPKWRSMNISQLRCHLKDIYFPYIQCDEFSRRGKTEMPIEFQVNGKNLAEILGGEVAVTNVNSCNGPDFTLQLHLTRDTNHATSHSSLGYTASREANARLKCVYFPITRGKESIDRILEKLKVDGCGTTEDYKNFSRVSVRRLGRLLPDARWVMLPFMEPKQKKGDRAQILKRCCYRVKCFIDTDTGFKPTPSKTDLAHQNPYTIALRSFGKKHHEKEKDVHIKIHKDGKELNLSKLEKLFEDWIIKMHNQYDEEIVSGNDEPTFIVDPSNKKELCISSDVIRVHKVFWRKEAIWRSGQKIKILKGAYVGHHKTNAYATLEFIILEGWEGDAGGEARLICRPIDLPDESGCRLVFDNGNASIKIGSSISLPISVIDSGKCVAIDDAVWDNQLQKRSLKVPSSMSSLSAKAGHELGIGGESSALETRGNNPHQSAQERILLLPESSEPSDVGNLIRCKLNHHENLHPHIEQHLNRGHENILSQSSEGKILCSQESSKLETLGNNPHQSAERRILLLPDSSSPSVVRNLIKCQMKDHEELEDELFQYGLCIKCHETNIEALNLQLSHIVQDVHNLQASLDLDQNLDCVTEKELLLEQIVCKGGLAAAVICRFFQSLAYKEKEIDLADKILGVVAFLGTVRTDCLSRIFAQYLGEHQMLAIVCKSYEDAAYLEKHEPDGRVNNEYGLHELAAKLGIIIEKQYHVLCLENIRPYTGEFSSEPQRHLLLPNPTLPKGKPPPGFLGYAVNMIELDVNFWQWRTASGHGLRETLFYRLFGELQVYENRQYMNMASSCIKDSAVSLDGGIMRGNGVISLGHWEADIKFPVVSLESLTYFSQRRVEVTKEIEAKEQALKETTDQLKAEKRTYAESLKKFRKTKERYRSLLDEWEHR